METSINVYFKKKLLDKALAVFAKAEINISNGQASDWEIELLQYLFINEATQSLEFQTEEDQWEDFDYISEWGTILAPFMENGEILCRGDGNWGIAIKDGIAYNINFIKVYGMKYEHRIDESGNYRFSVGENVKCYREKI